MLLGISVPAPPPPNGNSFQIYRQIHLQKFHLIHSPQSHAPQIPESSFFSNKHNLSLVPAKSLVLVWSRIYKIIHALLLQTRHRTMRTTPNLNSEQLFISIPAATIAPVIPIMFIKKILLLDVRGRQIRVVDFIVIVWLDTLKPPCLGLGCVTLIIVEARVRVLQDLTF